MKLLIYSYTSIHLLGIHFSTKVVDIELCLYLANILL